MANNLLSLGSSCTFSAINCMYYCIITGFDNALAYVVQVAAVNLEV